MIWNPAGESTSHFPCLLDMVDAMVAQSKALKFLSVGSLIFWLCSVRPAIVLSKDFN